MDNKFSDEEEVQFSDEEEKQFYLFVKQAIDERDKKKIRKVYRGMQIYIAAVSLQIKFKRMSEEKRASLKKSIVAAKELMQILREA